MRENDRPALTVRDRLVRTFLLVPVLAVGLAVLPAEAQTSKKAKNQTAKNLDLGLLKQAPEIVSLLSSLEMQQNKPYKNVAILPFKVKKGTREAGYYAGPLGTTLPGRLENALLMTMEDDEKKALRVIRDAAGTASQQKVGAWSKNKAQFDRLFTTSYPVAWGSKSVKPDLFLTGVISNEGNRATTMIEVVGFRKENWTTSGLKPFPVTKFTVKTDRNLLRDLGYSFALSRSVLRRDVQPQERDDDARQQVVKEEEGEKPPEGGQTQHSPANVAGISFDIFYGGVRQTVRAMQASEDGAKSPIFQVDPIAPGTKLMMTLTRTSDEGKRLGVVLKVNGESTFQRDTRDSLQCRKWLYDPTDKGKADKFEGFYMDTAGKEMFPFRVASIEESAAKASELGEKAGWITLDVYESGEAAQPEEQMMISTRGGARGLRKPATLAALQKQLLKTNNVRKKESMVTRRTAGGLILSDLEPVPGVPLEVGGLPNPVLRGSLSIKYYDPRTMDISE